MLKTVTEHVALVFNFLKKRLTRRKGGLKVIFTLFAVFIFILIVIAHTLVSSKGNPLFHKKWVASVFTSSTGTVQKHPSETIIFKPHLVLVKVGMTLYKEGVIKYTVIRGLKQGETSYTTVFIYPSVGPKITLYVFNHGTSLLAIHKAGDITVQQRYIAKLP